jgi:hypothetical protein
MDARVKPAHDSCYYAPLQKQSLLDTRTPCFVNRTLWPSHVAAGRIAQRESVPFTRERSKVRSLVRPPEYETNQHLYLIFSRHLFPQILGEQRGNR